MRFWLALLGALLCAAPAFAAPDLVLKGTITGADHETYKDIPFKVPAGVTRVTITFRHDGAAQKTVIDLGLFDNERFRGWSGGDKSVITISETDATPSYLIGPVRPGIWHLVLGIPNARKNATAEYEAEITFTRKGDPLPSSAFSDVPLAKGPAWYRGDLHLHSAHSDGSCESQSGKKVPCPLFKSLELATKRRLDFVAVSDHNTISQFNVQRELQPYFDKLLLIPGREITTFRGHANVFGPTDFIDFRLGSSRVPDLDALLKQVEAMQGLISVNHPKLPSGEICMGCGWSVAGTDWRRIPAIEIVNGGATALFGNADNPVSGIPFWEGLLNKGLRITAIGGSDNHNGTSAKAPIGNPVTVVYAADLSETAILQAIRAGHVYIDAAPGEAGYHPNGERIELTAELGGSRVIMGDALAAKGGEPVVLEVRSVDVGYRIVKFILDGKVVLSEAIMGSGWADFHDQKVRFKYTSDGQRHWVRAETRDEKDRLLMISNPVYLNFSN